MNKFSIKNSKKYVEVATSSSGIGHTDGDNDVLYSYKIAVLSIFIKK